MFGFVHRIVAFARPAMADTGVCPRKTVLVFVIAGLGWTLTTSALASSDGSPTPDVPPGSLCTIEAPSLQELNAAILTPPAGASPVPMRTPGTVPEGVPADAETMAAITAVVRELVGCYNAGKLLRVYGLYTDDYLYRLFTRQGGCPRASNDSNATPEPESDPSRHTAILSIADVRLLEDGTAGA